MGRCNGGGGRRTGGGGFQEGQKSGTKSGKTGHGKTGAHDAKVTQKEERRFDKWGHPLNYGPFKNGYYIGGQKQTAEAQAVGMAAEQVAALSLLTLPPAAPPAAASAASSSSAPCGAASARCSASSSSASNPSKAAATSARSKRSEQAMSAAQKKESERLAAAQSALDASPTHERMRATRANLPAHGSRTALLEAARASQSLVICGETGCGKSTQVPQYLLEEAIAAGTGAACTVLIAQPRRVAAISLAERVAAERGEAVGETVGYSIRHEGVHSAASTRLLFCTTGVILRRLQEDPSLAGVSHVVVDEAHERTADGDFLLMVLRRLLRTRDDLRVLLMSATLDATLFSSYFGDAPTLTIPGRTFEVTRRLSLLAACCLLLAACCLRLAIGSYYRLSTPQALLGGAQRHRPRPHATAHAP